MCVIRVTKIRETGLGWVFPLSHFVIYDTYNAMLIEQIDTKSCVFLQKTINFADQSLLATYIVLKRTKLP